MEAQEEHFQSPIKSSLIPTQARWKFLIGQLDEEHVMWVSLRMREHEQKGTGLLSACRLGDGGGISTNIDGRFCVTDGLLVG